MRHPAQKTYRLAPALAAIGAAVMMSDPTIERATMATEELARQTGLEVLLTARAGSESIKLARSASPNISRVTMCIGQRSPLMPPVGAPFVAYVWLAFGWGGVTLILAWFFLFDANDRAARSNTRTKPDRSNMPGLTIAEARRSMPLRLIAISTFVIMFFTVGLSIHQIPILAAIGISRQTAALLATMAGIATVVGKLLSGVLLDRFQPRWIGGLTLCATSLAYGWLIPGIHAPKVVLFAMLVNGYSQGAQIQIISYLVARYAGMRNFGAIFGSMSSVMAVSTGAGPLVAGLIYDKSGSYDLFLLAGALGSLVSSMLLFMLPAPPPLAAVAIPKLVLQP